MMLRRGPLDDQMAFDDGDGDGSSDMDDAARGVPSSTERADGAGIRVQRPWSQIRAFCPSPGRRGTVR